MGLIHLHCGAGAEGGGGGVEELEASFDLAAFRFAMIAPVENYSRTAPSVRKMLEQDGGPKWIETRGRKFRYRWSFLSC